MKKTLFLGLIISLIIVSCAKQESKFPQGAWQLVQTQSVANGKAEVRFPIIWTGSQIKMWSEKHFMFVGRWNKDTLHGDMYGGGTYTLEGNQYEEYVLYHNFKAFEGQKVPMSLELRNDTLIQTFHPVDSTGKQVENILVEKYIRLK